ncbi:YadA-like family protein [Veillonella parvula]|nr:ESPR-type extended signal peptide-containing protein [Veillonella parvula]MCB6805958.1 YadA-like family protein [Veillonella parvula]MCQ4927792.1 YadA-like family protein [Veillonella parvula]MCQ4958981.1 YadA-like family protein [Veillonella parvula]
MNKIFKVIWSKSKNCYVVVSEFAKNNSGKKKIVVAAILAALAMTNASISMASNDVPAGLPASAVGLGPSASVKGDKAVGFGYNASAAGGNSVVIGSNASVAAGSPQGIAIGGGNQTNEGARVIGEQAIAIGGNTIAQGNSSIVIGGDDVVKADGIKVVYTTNNGENKTGDLRSAVQSLTGFDMRNPLYTAATAGESGITLGMKGQSGNVGIAIGTGANAKDRLPGTSTGATGQANNDVTNAIAIGTGARANRDNAIAIGGGSNTDVGGTKQSSYTLPNNVVASWAGGDKTLPGDVVSFGSKGYERQLKHVAPGEVSATSTDAINGSQLSAIVDQIAYKYISIKSSDVANKDNTGATATNSIAIGPNAATDASASRSVAVGDGARGKVVDGVAVGSKSTADIASGVVGYNVNASRTDTYADLSGAALTSKLGGVAVGTTNQTRQINYVAAGTADTDAVNVAQLKSVNLAFTGDTGSGDVNLANSKLVVNGDNTYITTTANGKKITVSGKKQDITVANGSATATAGMADSANVANAINQAINQNKYGWNLSANGEATPVAVEKGNTVDFSGDDNITVARNDKKISVALKKDLSKLNSASFNNAGGNETVKIDGDKGINAGNLKVTNVADGIADKDAVNVSQLKKVDDKAEANKTAIDTNKTAIAKNAGDIATNKADIATNKANIAQNTTAIARKISLGGNSGSTDEKSLSTGDVKFNVKGENGLTTVANGDDVTVKLDDATKGKVDNAADRDLSNLTPDGKQQVKDLAAWNVVANNETAEKVEGGNTVKFIDGDNISITQNGKDFTISTKKDVTFDTVTATQTITAPKVKATTGVETPQVTGLTNTAWVPGQTQPVSGRAATEDQLKHVDDQVAENKANIADNTDKIGKNADAIADNKQKIADNKTAIDKNSGDIATNKTDIATNKDNIADNKQKIADNKAAIDKNAGDIATNKTDIATNKDNIAANKQKIADNKTAIDKNTGDIATNKADISTNKDNIATNKANIDKNTTAVGRKISLGGNSGSTDEKSLSTGDVKFNIKGENGLTTVANGDDVTVKLDDATKGKVDNAADRDLSNLTPDGKQQVKGLAAWNVVANNETAEKVEGGNTVKFIDGDNISITQNGKDFTISTKKDVTFDTITATQTITAPKVKATTGVETPQVTGLTNTTWVLGQTQPVSGRAATEDQLKHVDDQVAENKANIADNTDKIGKNADAIVDNKQKIADNKTAIDKNTGDIATNKADITANTDKIGKNADAIADNKQKIADNKTAIDKNAGDIATNKGDIASNKANIAQNTTAIARKISLGGNSGSTDDKSLSTGDVKFNVKGENGLTTVANGDDVTVKLDDTTKGKIDNAADRDLSNLTPDGKQQVKDLAAWNVVANNETAEKVEGGNTVKFIDGDNISITQNGKDFTVSTKKDVTFDTVTATQTITAPKVKATTGVETPQVTGLTNTAWVPGQTQPVSGRGATEDQLKKVDDQVAENKANIADNTDKIGKNADAIADNKQKIADNKTAIDKNAGDIATNKTDIATNKDNIAANKQKITDNKTAIDKNVGDIATNKANIAQNTTAIARKISLGGNSGSTDEKSLSTGDVKFNVKGENGLTTVANGDDVTVKLDDATKGKVDNAADRDLSNLTPDGKQQVKDLAAWNVVANNETAEKVEGGNTVKFIDGDNISITQNGKDFTISTKKDVTFDTVTANQTITAPKVKATTGVETPQVTGLTNTSWVPGQTQPVSGRGATEDQLKKVDDQVAENKANIADNTDKIGKNADAIADNKQKIADNKTAIDKNVGDIATNKANIAQNTTAIARKISLGGNSGSTDAKSLSTGDVKFNVKGENGLTTVANGDDVTVKLDDATKGKIDNAADRDLSNLTPDGKQQVKDLAAWNVVANNETAEKVEGGNTVKFIDGDNISITQNGKDFTISTKKDVTFDTVTATQTITAPKVKATTGVETPQVTGLTNTAWVPGQTQPVSGRAATEDQLKHVDDQVAENKANIADNKAAIDKNTGDIATNKDKIADNKQKIADNKAAIDKNAGDIATNKTDIATNKDNIATNKQKIADNKTAIDKNTGDIATNKGDIATNKQKIADNKTAIDKNTGDIASNKANIAQNTTAIARKISLGGNSGSTDEKSLSTGDVKFNVKGENGLTTVANGDDVTVKLDDTTKGKIDNAADRDLSNLTPDGKQQVKDLAAWNVVANNETAEKVEGGNTVKFIDGDNISITQNGKDFTVSTKKDVTFDTVTATQTITAPKVKATTGVETPQVTGLTNTAWVPGQTQPVSGRAATEDQLKKVDNQVAENKANIADNTDKIGKNAEAIADNKQKIADNKAAIDRNAADIATNKDKIATNKQNIADNKAAITKNAGDIATNKANIDKNTEAIARKISLGGNTGSTDEKSLSTGDVKFNIKGQNGIVTEANGEDVTVKLDDATANKINNAANTDLSNLTDTGKQQVKDLSAWNVVANGNTAEKVEGGNTVKFIDGDNISITQNGKDFTIATKQDVTFNTVKANQTITAPKVKATEGVETPQVTGLTNKEWISGQTQPVSGRAATEDQLKQVDNQVAENKANIADNKDKISKNTADIAANKGNISTNKQDIADNKAAIDRNAADIATNKDNIATNKQNIADNKLAITKNAGDIATNKANIDKNTEAIARKISLGGNSGSTDEKSLSTGDVKFNVKGENGLTTVANGDDVTVKLDDVTKGKIDNAANQDLSNLTDAGKQQVKDISAWNVTAAGGTVEKVQGGDTVKFQAGDNLVVNQDRTTFTYGLAKDLKGLNSVTVGDENGVSTKITPAGTTVKDAAGNSTVIKGGGMTITPADATASPVSLTVDGLNNGGKQIHGVAPGTDDTDAVNVSQLKASNAGLQEAVNRVGTETQRVGAHAAAMAALKPIQYDPLEPTQIMAGIGNYRGETAGAIGIAHYRTEDTMFNVGVSLGTSHNMVNAGVTHKFGGSRERKEAIPERYKAGPISSVYVMQDEVSSLKKENSNQKTVIANQAARLNTLEAENERQRQELAETKQGLDELRAVVNQLLASKG